MKAVLFYKSAADVLAKAPVHFPAHKARVDAFHERGELLAVGTWADPREGSMAVFRSRAAAEDFVKGDPFVLNGVVQSHEITTLRSPRRGKDWNESLLGD